MTWRADCRDVPEGQPILVWTGEDAVVALAFAGDDYFPDTTFMDARTFEILPTPSHWMPLPEGPGGERPPSRRNPMQGQAACPARRA
jgi:hypothetical protein